MKKTLILAVLIAGVLLPQMGMAQNRGSSKRGAMPQHQKSSSNQTFHKKKDENHFVFMTSAELLGGAGKLVFAEEEGKRTLPNNKNFVVGVQQIMAYQFNPYVTLGVGAGLDVWKRAAFIPVFANISINMLDKNFAPHWYANVGYSFKWYVTSQPEKVTKVIHGATPGLLVESGIGLRMKMKDNFSILLLANYKMQQSQLLYSVDVPGESHYASLTTNRSKNMLYHFVGLKIGFIYF